MKIKQIIKVSKIQIKSFKNSSLKSRGGINKSCILHSSKDLEDD